MYTKESLLQENLDTTEQSLSSFETNSPKGNMLKNQNNFSNKGNSFIPHCNNDLPTTATSDSDLQSSIQSSPHSNSKTLELFDKSSVADFTVGEILTELENESKIYIMAAYCCFHLQIRKKFFKSRV